VEAGERAGVFPERLLTPAVRKHLAIEIGGTKLQLFAGDERGEILQRWRFDVDRARGGDGIRAQIAGALPEILRAHDVAAVGVGYGGPVDWRTGQICCSHQIEGWADFPLGDWLRERTSRPVFIDNDANVAALGEALRGAGQGSDPVFYATLGSGVGGGLVVNGRILHGAKPGESEIGHVRLDKSGVIIEQRCSGWAVDERIRASVARDPAVPLARLTQGMAGCHARALGPAIAEGCPLARRLLAEVCDDLAFALSHVTHLVHPEVIVLGGGLSLAGEPLRAGVATALPRYVMHAFGSGPRIALAALREDAVPVGALLLASQQSARSDSR
jgi:glucokinase